MGGRGEEMYAMDPRVQMADWPDDVDPRDLLRMQMEDDDYEYHYNMEGDDAYYRQSEMEYDADYEDYMYSDHGDMQYPAESNYDDYYTPITFTELLDHCVLPTLSQAITTIYPLLGLCLVTRLTAHFISEAHILGEYARMLYHLCCLGCGLWALYIFFQEQLLYIVMHSVLSYLLLLVTICKCRGWSGIAVSCVTAVYLVTCELVVVDSTSWHRVRGPEMVLSMKVISLGFDLDTGTVINLPKPWEFAGYTFQVGSVVFGPWISYNEYSNLQAQRERKLDFYWIIRIVWSLLLSLVCVIISSCIVHWFIHDNSFIWVLAYRDAASFRFSHYFVCFLSEVTMVMSGLGASKNNGDIRWDISVSRLLHIEFPRSLVEVVTNWHLPMHHWLKTYVFKTARPLGKFAAILLTYAASSLLHGLNFQLGAVLLSLGFYSYIEFVLRKRLSQVFSACVQAKRCKPDCQHIYPAYHLYVIIANFIFGCITVFHLAYLGLMFDSSSEEDQGYNMEHTLGKWTTLGYASHWASLATYIFYLLI